MSADGRWELAALGARVRALESCGRRRSMVIGDRIEVQYDQPGLRTWLAEALWPSFPVTDGPGGAQHRLQVIHAVIDPAPYRGWPAQPVAAFVDGDPVLRIRSATGPGGERFLWYSDSDLVVDRGNDLVLISGRPEAGITARRILRNHMLYPWMQADGFLPVHAAAVADPEGGAVLFAGPKRAGKTSSSLPLVLDGGWSLIASDLTFVGSEVRGSPEDITLGIGTILESPRLAPLRPPEFNDAVRGDSARWDFRAKVALRLADFSRQSGVPVSDRGDLKMFVFPAVAPGHQRPVVRSLPEAEVARRILANVTSPEWRGFGAMLSTAQADGEEVKSAVLAHAMRLAAAVPGVELIHDGRRLSHSWLRDLVDS